MYHFHPGSRWLSLGSFGCNFLCPGCHNWDIVHSQVPDDESAYTVISPEGLVKRARQQLKVFAAVSSLPSTTPFSRPSRIFDSTFTTKKGEHFGLGLAIVKKLVEAHGGKVRVESEGSGKDAEKGSEKGAGKGAAFIITLPHDAQGWDQRLC